MDMLTTAAFHLLAAHNHRDLGNDGEVDHHRDLAFNILEVNNLNMAEARDLAGRFYSDGIPVPDSIDAVTR